MASGLLHKAAFSNPGKFEISLNKLWIKAELTEDIDTKFARLLNLI